MPYWNSSLAAILRGAETPAQLQNLKSVMIEQIHDLRSEVSEAYRDDELSHLHEQLLADGSTTLVVMGERGTGKSTLLVSLCAELISNGTDLVLPIMRPDLFADNDSVVSSFLASLWATLAPSQDAPEESAAGKRDFRASPEILKLLADTARSQAASRTTLAALEHATDGPVDFAEDAVSVSRSRIRLSRQIRRLAKELCLPNKEHPARLILVPIDDPDVAPVRVTQILRDLRVLGSVPGIVPVACLCASDLSAAWASESEARWSNTDTRRLARNFEQETQKIFPFRYRFTIEAPTASQRIAFTPVAQTGDLGSKIREFRQIIESTRDMRWEIDDALTFPVAKFGIPNPLPPNPRSLLQLWESLDALNSTAPSAKEWATIVTLRRMLDLLGEDIRSWSSTSLNQPLYQIGSADAAQTEPDQHVRQQLSFSFDQFDLFISAQGPFEPNDNGNANLDERTKAESLGAISLRPLYNVRASITRPRAAQGVNPAPGRNETQEREYLPPSELASLLALQEIAYGSGAFDVDGSTLFIGKREWAFLQQVILGHLATDNVFIMLPEATTLAEMIRVATLWNELVERSKQNTSVEHILTGVVAAACAFVEGKDSVSGLLDYEGTLVIATETYLRERGRREHASRSFCKWYERDLIFQWHTAFLGIDRIRGACRQYQSAISRGLTTAGLGDEPTVAFDARLQRIMDGIDDDRRSAEERCWIAGYFDTAAALGSRNLRELGRLNGYWRERTASLRAGVAVASGFVSQGVGTQRLTPYPTPEGQELLESALEMLRRRRESSFTHHGKSKRSSK